MTSRLRAIGATVFTGALVALPAFAADNVGTLLNKGLTGASGSYAGTETDLSVVIGRIIAAALGIVGALLLIYLIYAGFLWMTAEGDEKKVTKAKDMIRSTIVGLVIIVSAAAISTYVLRELTVVVGGQVQGAVK